jgi:hypothetical protein
MKFPYGIGCRPVTCEVPGTCSFPRIIQNGLHQVTLHDRTHKGD